MDWAEDEDRRQRPHHALRRLQLRRPGGDPRCGGALRRRRRGGVPQAPLRARDARPRPHHPHERRAAPEQLPAVAVRLLRARLRATSCGPTSTARRFEAVAGRVRARRAGSGAADGRRAARRARAPSAGAPRGARTWRAHRRRGPGDRASRSFIVLAGGWFFVGGPRRCSGLYLPARALRDVRVREPVAAGRVHRLRRAARRGASAATPTRSCSRSSPRSRWSSCSASPSAATRGAPGVVDHAARAGVDRARLRARGAAARPAPRRRRSSSTCSSARSSATPAPTSAAAPFGRGALAPSISPNKTVEGLVIGIVVAIAAVWFAGLYQDWLGGWDALLLGVAVAIAAPLGDLFESYLKRDAGTKDTGTLFGAARRRAGPPRRGAVRRGRRVLRLAGAAVGANRTLSPVWGDEVRFDRFGGASLPRTRTERSNRTEIPRDRGSRPVRPQPAKRTTPPVRNSVT